MSLLRISGIALALAFALWAVWRYRRRAFGKTDLLLMILFSALIAAVSVNPNLVNTITNLVSGERVPYRLIFLTMGGVGLLYVLWMRQTARMSRQERKLTDLLDALTARSFVQENPDLEMTGQVLAVIPAYNEAGVVGQVLDDMPSEVAGLKVHALVVDDASTDDTAAEVREHGGLVVSNPINRGGGGALRVGYALAQALGAAVVVTLDADGQHVPQEMGRLVEPIVSDRQDLVVGSRVLGVSEGGALVRQVGIFFFNRMVSLMLRRKVTDCSSGYKAIRTSWLDRLELTQEQFHTSEFLISAVRAGARFQEVPITIKLRTVGHSKKGGSLKYGLGFSRAIFSAWWRK